ncbi:ABC transporter ATP-binding protein [Citreimonas salinaria]|uniref:Branched-chain amino acid transport system ATP-binding protein n=1 Tax=Citreimonas salinaria TaxID=321339 RepID=A0A1H3LDZ9_9RHOB|nr:ABC transporter ATP-binding protein [Citreimonas salinaria]SDY62105.1 branched-chain amino acid transport system ATP-binding protein [Citreimonas salinaria]
MLELRDVSVSYGKHLALENAALKVGKSEIVVILGANGAGKSTLLKAISGISEGRVTGSVSLGGEHLTGLPAHRIVEAGVALVPEGRGVFGELDVIENLLLGAYATRAQDDQQANLDRVMTLFPRLDERRRQQVRTMSGGEQQMVAIGRAMMSSPEILMLDEPSLGLSPLLSKDLFASLKTVRDAGIGILLVEQNAKASLAVADRGYLLENGHIVHGASAKSLAGDPAVQAAYLGGKAKGIAARPATAASAQPAPRPAAGPSPSDIAAAAVASVRSAPRPASDALEKPARPKQAAAPKPAVTPPARPARPSGAQRSAPVSGQVHGIAIGDLVARASETSRTAARSVRAVEAPEPVIRAGHAAPPPRDLPRLDTDSRDRLSQILTEIEEAAARAEAWRPSRRN